MKKILFATALLLATLSCSRNGEDMVVGEGSIRLNVATRSSVADTSSEGGTNIAQYLPKAEELRVKIEGVDFLQEWSSLAAFNTEIEGGLLFASAPYTISLASGNADESGYGKAYFEGSTSVDVPGYKLSAEANIEVVLANSVVAIETTDLFDGYFPQSEFSVGGITYDKESRDMLFVKSGEVEIVCKAVRQAHLESGKLTTITKSVTLKPTTRHTLKFDLSTAGNISVNISFDDEIVETIDLEFELNENA